MFFALRAKKKVPYPQFFKYAVLPSPYPTCYVEIYSHRIPTPLLDMSLYRHRTPDIREKVPYPLVFALKKRVFTVKTRKFFFALRAKKSV